MAIAGLPELPAPHSELVEYIARNPKTPLVDIIEPYRQYEAHLRTVYAQDRQNPALDDPLLNVVPLFTDATQTITTRARNLDQESEDESSKYIMVLPDDKRRPHNSPATVANIAEFQNNFNIFSESSLAEIDWSNVVAAGSSVVNCLLPVPKEFNTSKRKLREYYHEKFCPASDVDLFLYGLTHEQAVEKMKQIEQAIRDAILNEVTVVRTKYAITIASQYPVRHVQIVLRVYKSVSEILTGFDIDAAGGAYDGKQVYVTPRALGSFISQINHVDLSRRSPSYENRLSKYSHRNFEVYWPDLDRARVDPTIFERSFQRTLGLARLLVLERLPTSYARDAYLDKRRQERGRPAVYRNHFRLHGDIKGRHEDEVADWLSEEDVSSYHTFTVPYGEKFNAKKIEKLCYTRDLLLNAEWNQPDKREVYLHRHPAFFGRVQDVIEDCCGVCPKATTPEEVEISKKEAEIYISGQVSFMIDDPGRQQIGSFNPLTEQDWTDMAYVGNTARLCQSIVDGDADDVRNWLSQDGADPNQRDYTGRSPLHLATMVSTPEVVQCLIQHGSRLTARLADGKTALHLAAFRGNVDIIRILMEKSDENEAAEHEKAANRRGQDATTKVDDDDSASDGDDNISDAELVENEETDADRASMATGSFVKIKKEGEDAEDAIPEDSEDEPDYYDINVFAWDIPCSPLHLAIAEGHEDAVEVLCEFGADAILPVKLPGSRPENSAAILTLVLALSLPKEKAKSMARLLLKHGAVSSQADAKGCTAFHRYIDSGNMEMIDLLLENDKIGIKSAINHLYAVSSYWDPVVVGPLESAIKHGDAVLILKLLDAGAHAQIDFDTWLKAIKFSEQHANRLGALEQNKERFKRSAEQPIIAAIRTANFGAAVHLLENGADPNALPEETERFLTDSWRRGNTKAVSALDMVRDQIKELRDHIEGESNTKVPPMPTGMDAFLEKFEAGTYKHWIVSESILHTREEYERHEEQMKEGLGSSRNEEGAQAKKEAIEETLTGLKQLEITLLGRGAKTFAELYPDIPNPLRQSTTPDKSESTVKEYEYVFSFRNSQDLNDARRDGYVELMEAAWSGDLERIKTLTLEPWGPEKNEPPLMMAICDGESHSPFSVAFFRGHYGVARAILEIVKTQWSPHEDDKVRYRMKSGDEDPDSDNDEEYSDDDGDSDSEPRIVAEKVDKDFTIENIGQASLQVKSHSKPLDVLCGSYASIPVARSQSSTALIRSLFVHCIDKEHTAGLKFLLDVAQHYSGEKMPGNDDGTADKFNFSMEDFRWAVENGKTQLLGLVMKRTGAGLPLDEMVKKSGVKMEKKPRYYQGLTVYGKKRRDWATAGRNMTIKATGLKTPPLLHAALGGHIETVEFFLSDAPHRLYSEYSRSHAGREDSRLKHLKDSPGGFDRAISKWLGADNDLIIHCAVVAKPSDRASELLEYLIETCPASLEKKSTLGETPLMMACRLGRVQAVKLLLDGNADQSVKNPKGENILHAALAENPNASQMRTLLDMLDAGLRSHLFTQRKNLQENGTTPLHAWISQVVGLNPDGDRAYQYEYNRNRPYDDDKDVADMLNLLLEYSKGAELDMLNGAGETCLHTAIKFSMLSVVKILVDFRTSLLYRENAVGRTPAEIAQDKFTGQQFAKPTELRPERRSSSPQLVHRKPEDFLADKEYQRMSPEQAKTLSTDLGLSGDYSPKELSSIVAKTGTQSNTTQGSPSCLEQVIWDLCRTAMEKHPGNRRLVSLNEANDVAKRLGEKHTSSRYFTIQTRTQSDDGEEDQEENQGAEKAKTDFASQEMESRRNTAWEKKVKGTSWCSICKYHHKI